MRAFVLADNRKVSADTELQISDIITAVASTDPPQAAENHVVLRAMKNWAKWSKGDETEAANVSVARSSSLPAPPKPAAYPKPPPRSESPPSIKKRNLKVKGAEAEAGVEEEAKKKKKKMKTQTKTKESTTKSKEESKENKEQKKDEGGKERGEVDEGKSPVKGTEGVRNSVAAPSSPTPTPLAKKEAVKVYLSARKSMLESNSASISRFNKHIKKLVKSIPRRLIVELASMKIPPDAVCAVSRLVLGVLDFKASKSTTSWKTVKSSLLSPQSEGWRKFSAFDECSFFWCITSKAIMKSIVDFTEEGYEIVSGRLSKISLLSLKFGDFIFAVRNLWTEFKGQDELDNLIRAGAQVRKAFKGNRDAIPKSVLGRTGGSVTLLDREKGDVGKQKKIAVAVRLPSAKAIYPVPPATHKPKTLVTPKLPKKGSKASKHGVVTKKSNAGGDNEMSGSLTNLLSSTGSEETDTQTLSKLEHMVGKLTNEISRLESKIASSPGATTNGNRKGRPSSAKKTSPVHKKKISPGRKAVEDASASISSPDPELITEISTAVASRLKQMWSLDD